MNIYRRRFLSTEARFLSQVERVPFCSCWFWMGTIKGGRYGKFWRDGRSESAHRAAWLLFKSEIPAGMLVCHHCDVPYCVNPDHLFLGTAKENTTDMIRKARNEPMLETRRGERNNFNKLSKEQVLEIRTATGRQRDIASKYGVTQGCVSLIKSGKNWKHADS